METRQIQRVWRIHLRGLGRLHCAPQSFSSYRPWRDEADIVFLILMFQLQLRLWTLFVSSHLRVWNDIIKPCREERLHPDAHKAELMINDVISDLQQVKFIDPVCSDASQKVPALCLNINLGERESSLTFRCTFTQLLNDFEALYLNIFTFILEVNVILTVKYLSDIFSHIRAKVFWLLYLTDSNNQKIKHKCKYI